MPPVEVLLVIPEAEAAEAKQAAEAFTSTSGGTSKALLAAVANEVIRKWRDQTKGQSKGQIT